LSNWPWIRWQPLPKDRVADVTEFVEALARVASGGTAQDPEVVSQLVGASRRAGTLVRLSPREREVLSLMAEGRSNAALAPEPYDGRAVCTVGGSTDGDGRMPPAAVSA
jgi:hypothetical protein